MLEDSGRPIAPVRFGLFEVDFSAAELRRKGVKVKLQDQPFQVLVLLIERHGEVVTREELQKTLWPVDTFVDFERGLNRAINKLREALDDDADNPRFIETLPRRGYRFLVPIEPVELAGVTNAASGEAVPAYIPRRGESAAGGWLNKAPITPWAITAIATLAAVLALWRPWVHPRASERPFSQFDLDLAPDEFSHPAISPDGSRIVFVAKHGLAMRRFDQSKTTPIAGTEGATFPFFSPDGRWVAFFQNNKLQKLDLEGGSPVPLCEAPEGGGGSWGSDGKIVAVLHSSHKVLSEVPAAGGLPRPLMDPKGTYSSGLIYLQPQVLPGNKHVLIATSNVTGQGSLSILDRSSGQYTKLIDDSTRGRYLASGHLIYHRHGQLFAARMNLNRPDQTGPGMLLMDAVSRDFDVSNSGTLVYERSAAEIPSVVSWLDPFGKLEPLISEAGYYSTPRLSPDGTRLAIAATREGKQNIWVYDLKRESFTRLTYDDGPDSFPVWSPDSQYIMFRSGNVLACTRSDGSGRVELLKQANPNSAPWSFSADGRWLAFWPLQPDSDLWIAPVQRAPGMMRLGPAQLLVQRPGSKGAPALSPDGRWVAFTSSDSGRFEVYVMPFLPSGEGAGAKWQVSNDGGWAPTWSPNGRELLYQNPHEQTVHAASYVAKNNSFVSEKPRPWGRTSQGTLQTGYDVSSDGKRLLVLIAAGEPRRETHLRVLLNVDSELRRRALAAAK